MDPSEGKRSHRHHLQNILSHRLVGAFRRLRNGRGTLASDAAAGGGGGSGSGYRTGTLTYNAYAADACSTLSMPASYSASYYTDDFSSVHEGGDTTSVITVSDLDREHRRTGSSRRNRRRRNIDSLEYPEYANMETFKQCLGSDRKHSASGSADVTPTNGRATLKPSPDGGIMNEDFRTMTRLRSMRDTERRMRSVMQVPSYILTASELEADDDSRLGFANIPDQMHRKAVKKGFNFTLMIAGESGLGKATLVNSLFMQDLYKDREEVDANERIHKVTKIEKRQIELDERGVKLRLTIVDTPGFNDAVNAEECWKPIEDYIDGTFEQYFKDECGLNRKNIQDNRVHCCLYFISPYGHGLRQVDVEFMRHLQNKVNIVPVIAKADALTAAELRDLKDRIMSDLDRYKIDIYRLPECDSDEEEEIKRLDKEIKAVLPFAVIGSNCVIEGEGGKRVRGRQYPWGVVEVENPRHCDFTKLRIFLLKTHMQDLKDMTLEVHYENYRAKYITERMSKRQTDRREAGGAHRTDRENGPGFDAIVDADCLLRQKEEELQRLQHSGAKTLDLTARAKNPDASSLHSNGAGQNPAQSNTVSSTRSAMSGPGTLPPKATATGL